MPRLFDFVPFLNRKFDFIITDLDLVARVEIIFHIGLELFAIEHGRVRAVQVDEGTGFGFADEPGVFPADDTVDAFELEVVLDAAADGDQILVELVFVVPRRRAGLGDLQLNRHALFSSIHLKVRSREIRIDPESA